MPNNLSDLRPPRSIAATDSAPNGAGRNGAGQAGELANRILLGLPRNLCNNLLAKAPLVKLPTHSVLNEVNEPIQYFYFINSGLASVLNVLQDGKSVEVGLTGREGVVGVPIVVGFKTSPTRVVMQIAGSGYRMPAKDLQAALKASSVLEKSLLKYSQELALQAGQIAACNRVHEVDERLARWLLMSQDRLGGSLIPLTQEFLAPCWHAARQRHRRGGHPAKSRIDQLCARAIEDRRSQSPGKCIVRVLRDIDSATQCVEIRIGVEILASSRAFANPIDLQVSPSLTGISLLPLALPISTLPYER